jgi:hypothetical protein
MENRCSIIRLYILMLLITSAGLLASPNANAQPARKPVTKNDLDVLLGTAITLQFATDSTIVIKFDETQSAQGWKAIDTLKKTYGFSVSAITASGLGR